MLGRLFASNGSLAASKSNGSSPVKDDATKPISVLEEADTRALLYGPAVNLNNDLNMDLSAKDMKVVVLVDMQCMDDYVFDSSRPQEPPSVASAEDQKPKPNGRSISTMNPTTTSNRRLNHNRRATVGGGSSPPQHPGSPQQSPVRMEHVPITIVKDVLFGSAPIRFTDSVTKLHPVNSEGPKNTWILSRLFKVCATGGGNGGFCEDIPTSIIPDDQSPPSSLSNHHLSGVVDKSEDHEYDDDGLPFDSDDKEKNPWNPDHPVASHKTTCTSQDIRCGFCVFFNLNSESDVITSHWDELSIAMADLQKAIYYRLCDTLPNAIKDLRYRKKGNTRRVLNLDGDETVRSAVEFFRLRFFGVVKIPRVLCGQERWSELHQEIKLMLLKMDPNHEDGFLSAILASFIKCNQTLIQQTASLRAGAVGDPPTRTIVISNNRIPSRRLIFILTSLIYDKSSRLHSQQLQMWNSKLSIKSDDDDDEEATSSIVDGSPVSRASSRTAAAEAAAAQLNNRGGGWEIPKSAVSPAGESTSSCTMPHVIRPAFSSSSLSNSLSNSVGNSGSTITTTATKYPSIDGLRKNFFGAASGVLSSGGSLFTSSGSTNSSLFSSLWSSNSSRASDTISSSYGSMSSVDEIGGYYDSSYNNRGEFPSTAATRPGLNRLNSVENARTATRLLSPQMQKLQLNDTDDDSREDDHRPTLNYEYVQEEDGSLVLEVEPLLQDDDPTLYEPIVLPPVAGHLPDFHPEFGIQAVSMSRDLEQKVAGAMIRDSERLPAPTWATLADSRCATPTPENFVETNATMSRTLIINLMKREIYEWSLNRSCSNLGGCQQYLSRKKLYAANGSKQQQQHYRANYGAWSSQIGSCFKKVVNCENGNEAVGILKDGFKNAFGITSTAAA